MTDRRRRLVLAVLLVLYLATAAAIGFWATPVDGPFRRWVLENFSSGQIDDVRGVIRYSTLEAAANVAFFVPLGALVAAMLPARLWAIAIPIGAAFSCCLEFGQLLFLPARFASWHDLVENTIGTLIGVAIVLAIRAIVALARRRRRS